MLSETRSEPRPVRRFLSFPYLANTTAPAGWRSANPEHFALVSGDAPLEVDAVFITARVAETMLNRLFARLVDRLTPVVNLGATSQAGIDERGNSTAWERAEAILERIAYLPATIRQSKRDEDVLLARMFTRDADLTAHYAPESRALVDYPIAGNIANVPEIANRLVRGGQLQATFFDRVYVCPDCSSSLLSVREECHSCRSPDVHEQAIVHHFRCGFEGPDESFQTPLSTMLQCPKCADRLRHIGLDYDKPGTVMHCHSCGHRDDSTAVGFVCIHCAAKHDAAQMPARNHHSYAMTPSGLRQVLNGHVENDPTSNTNATVFDVMLHGAIQQQASLKTPFQVLDVRFGDVDMQQRGNPRLWSETHKLALDVMNSSMRDVDIISVEGTGFKVLMPQIDQRSALKFAKHIKSRIAEVLILDPDLKCSLLTADQVAALTRVRGLD
ncbi:TackOD1 domain-containing metal-binding protein [Methylobacterium oxalidis]|uniref:TackOD1 domain-containing metal-binding protein n=1 Tax=Methylobacterium oxalidis TaxID=944322 RepID=UPI0033150BF8